MSPLRDQAHELLALDPIPSLRASLEALAGAQRAGGEPRPEGVEAQAPGALPVVPPFLAQAGPLVVSVPEQHGNARDYYVICVRHGWASMPLCDKPRHPACEMCEAEREGRRELLAMATSAVVRGFRLEW